MTRRRARSRRQRYRFEAVKRALTKHWGLDLYRGGSMGDGDPRHTGRWTIEYSRTGFVIGGQWPRGGFGYRRFDSLVQIVRNFELAAVIRALPPETTTPKTTQPVQET